MGRLKSAVAVLCAFLMLVPLAQAQQIQYVQTQQGGFFSRFLRPYEPKDVLPVDVANSGRLESLLRAGNIYLSLQDAIALALENNLDIHIQRYGRSEAEANLLRAKAGGLLRGLPNSVQTSTTAALSQITGGGAFGTAGSSGGTSSGGSGGTIITATGSAIPNLDPSMYVVGYWDHTSTPQSNAFTTGTTNLVYRNDVYAAGYQQGFLTGTNVQLNWQQSTTKANATTLDFNPSTTGSLNLQVTQPLLQGFGLAVNNRNIRIARNNMKVNDLLFKQQVMTTVSQIVAAYWDLVSFNENVKVKQQALDLSQRLYSDNKKQVEIGTLAPIEIVRAEAEVASRQQDLVNAQTQVLQQETALKNALSRNGLMSPSVAEAHIIPTDVITVPDTEPVVPVQDLISKALANRPEVPQSKLNIDSTRIGLKGDRSQMLPALNLIGNLTNNGLAGQINPLNPLYGPNCAQLGACATPVQYFIGGGGDVLRQELARNFPSYSLQAQLSIPLRNRSAQADYILDALTLRTQELQHQRLVNSIGVDVRNALIAVQQAGASYHAAVQARVLQEQTLDAENKKYALGASTIFLVIQAQRDLAQARSNEVTAISAYAKSKVQLDNSLGTVFDTYQISVDEAVNGRVSRAASPLPPAK
ncbi:MAG TPA: TolC family protein [Bryobacteraceae bacterium]|nr:TolC family protein [Bryobacteraceae bacterium]